jgi:hypothetical protein
MDQPFPLSDMPSKTLYRIAGTVALLIVIAGLIDAITSLGVDARDNRTVQIVAWFALFQTHWFAAFSRLGLINLITVSLGIPIYLAFHQAYRRDHPALVSFASILFFVGAAVYLSSNTVFPLFGLSQQYLGAPEAQKPVLEAAGRALLSQGADLTPGTFLGLIFVQCAGLLMTSLMLQGALFGKWTGRVGLAGYMIMILFFILTAFVPERYAAAMMISAPGGLLLMAYQLLLARKFFALGKATAGGVR